MNRESANCQHCYARLVRIEDLWLDDSIGTQHCDYRYSMIEHKPMPKIKTRRMR